METHLETVQKKQKINQNLGINFIGFFRNKMFKGTVESAGCGSSSGAEDWGKGQHSQNIYIGEIYMADIQCCDQRHAIGWYATSESERIPHKWKWKRRNAIHTTHNNLQQNTMSDSTLIRDLRSDSYDFIVRWMNTWLSVSELMRGVQISEIYRMPSFAIQRSSTMRKSF